MKRVLVKLLAIAALVAANGVLAASSLPATAVVQEDEWGNCGQWGGGSPPQCICMEGPMDNCNMNWTVQEMVEYCNEYAPRWCAPWQS